MMLTNLSFASTKAQNCISSAHGTSTHVRADSGRTPPQHQRTQVTELQDGWRQGRQHLSAFSHARYCGELVEMHIAVRLRPETDLSRNGLRPRVVQVQLAVEIALDLGAG